MTLIARSKDPIGDANKAVDDAVAESERRGNIDPEDVLAEWIVGLRDQLAGAVDAERVGVLAERIARDRREPDKVFAYATELANLVHPRGQ